MRERERVKEREVGRREGGEIGKADSEYIVHAALTRGASLSLPESPTCPGVPRPGPSARSLSRFTERFRYSLRVPRLSLRVSQSVSQSAGATRFARIVTHRAPFASERGKFARLSHSPFHPFFALLLALSLTVLPIEGVDNRALKSPRDLRDLRRAEETRDLVRSRVPYARPVKSSDFTRRIANGITARTPRRHVELYREAASEERCSFSSLTASARTGGCRGRDGPTGASSHRCACNTW